MKQITKILAILAAGVLVFTACSKDNGPSDSGNSSTITASLSLSQVTYTTDDLLVAKSDVITVTLSSAAEQIFMAGLAVDEDYVSTYNSAYSASAVILPSSAYSISGSSFLISAGSTTSNSITVTFSGSTVGLTEGQVYVLPLVATLDSGLDETFTLANNPHYLVFECDYLDSATPGIKMSNMMGYTATIANSEVVDMGDNTHTFEVRIYPYNWHDDGEISYICSWTGKDKNNNNESFNGMELRYSGTNKHSGFGNRQCDLTASESDALEEDEISTDAWHTISIVCDGSLTGQNTEKAYWYYLDGELIASAAPAKRYGAESSQGFEVGYTLTGMQLGYNNNKFYFDGLLGEIRMWKTALTQNEIQANLQTVDNPSADEMYVYWKVNEGIGNTLTDYSGNDRNLTFTSVDLEWSSENETK